MKEINVKLRKGWKKIPSSEIYDWSAPIGALVWGAEPEETSSASFYIYTYQSVNSNALTECAKCSELIDGGQPVSCPYAGHNAFYIYKHFCGGQIVIMYFFVEVEDYIVTVISRGTEKQAVDNMQWIENHSKLGDEIPNENGNPVNGGTPLCPPAMLFHMVDFTQRDYDMTRQILPQLPSHFDFIVQASNVAATSVDQLVERVNEDYSRHYGYRELDYDLLSDKVKNRLPKDKDFYIGLGMKDVDIFDNPMQAVIFYGFTEEPFVNRFPLEELMQSISETIIDMTEASEPKVNDISVKYVFNFDTETRTSMGEEIWSMANIELTAEEYKLVTDKLEIINASKDVFSSLRKELPEALAERFITVIRAECVSRMLTDDQERWDSQYEDYLDGERDEKPDEVNIPELMDKYKHMEYKVTKIYKFIACE